MQKLPDRIDSKYRFVLLASERAEQLIKGALPRIAGGPKKPTQAAMAEVLADVVEWDFGPAPEVENSEEKALAAGEGEEAESVLDEKTGAAEASS